MMKMQIRNGNSAGQWIFYQSGVARWFGLMRHAKNLLDAGEGDRRFTEIRQNAPHLAHRPQHDT